MTQASTVLTAGDRLRSVTAPAPDFLRLCFDGCGDDTASHAEILERAGARGGAIADRVGDGRVVLVLPHGRDVYELFLGGLLCGYVPSIVAPPQVRVDPDDYDRALAAQLEVADPDLVITTSETCQRAASLTSVPLLDVAKVGESLGCSSKAGPDDTAFIQYSSGTTGAKKGVAVSHRALLWQVDRYADVIGATAEDRIISWLPLYHDMGLVACFLMPFLRGIPVVAQCPFEWIRRPSSWLELVTAHRGTLSWLPNFAYALLAARAREDDVERADLSSLRGVVNCSEPLREAAQDRFMERFAAAGFRPEALASSYAMAENTFAVTSAGFGTPQVSAAGTSHVSSGRPLPDTTVTIVDDAGAAVPEGTPGEIVVESPCLFTGYVNNAEATEATLRGNRLFTGDVGFLDAGHLFVTGRARDLLIIRGENVFPQDVEAVVDDVDGVIPGRAVAIAVSNEASGTDDLVVLAESRLPETNAIADAIRSAVASAVGMAPADVRVMPERWLKKSTSGKMARGANRARYLELVHDEVHVRGREVDPIRRAVEGVVHARRGRATVLAEDDRLLSAGLIDSLSLVELLQAIEDAAGVRIPSTALGDPQALDTIAAIRSLVEEVRGGGAVEEAETWPTKRQDVRLSLETVRSPRRTEGFWSRVAQFRLRRAGVRVGKGLRALGPILLRFDGNPRNVAIGNDVTLMPYVDLKVRENGRIILHDGAFLDTNARLVAANDGRLEVGENAAISMGSIVNAGMDVIIGARTQVAGSCTIMASEHRYDGRTPIVESGYDHAPVYIDRDVWIAANVVIARGTRIGEGAVIGAQSMVRGDVPAFAVVMGNPGRIVGRRSCESSAAQL